MESGVLWREVATEVHRTGFAELTLHRMLADNCAMQLARGPRRFDAIVTDNLFGDLLSDAPAEADMLDRGARAADPVRDGGRSVSTAGMGDAAIAALEDLNR